MWHGPEVLSSEITRGVGQAAPGEGGARARRLGEGWGGSRPELFGGSSWGGAAAARAGVGGRAADADRGGPSGGRV